MLEPAPSWRHVGDTTNADLYLTPAGILVSFPMLGSRDTEETAKENRRFVEQFWRSEGSVGGFMVLFDRGRGQDAGARRVWATDDLSAVGVAFAMVGGTLFGRAMGSFFLGLTRPSSAAPIRFFRDAGEALTWLESYVDANGRGTLP